MEDTENFTVLYVPDFLTGLEANEDFAFFGTDKGNIFIFSIHTKVFVSNILNPT